MPRDVLRHRDKRQVNDIAPEGRRVLHVISCEKQFALPGLAAIVAPDPLYLHLYLHLDFGPAPCDGQTAEHVCDDALAGDDASSGDALAVADRAADFGPVNFGTEADGPVDELRRFVMAVTNSKRVIEQ